ncbi:MAG: trigger factor [Blastocatellia bacterium]
MEVAVVETAETKRVLDIEIPADVVQQKFDAAYASFMQHATVPGFRQGKAPRTVIRQRFGKDARGAVLEDLLPHALQHALQDHKLQLVGSPEISDLTLREGQPLKFRASMEVIPPFELQPYKDLKLTRRVRRVTEEDIDQTIGRLREQATQLVPVEDRVSETGDVVSFNIAGTYVDPQSDVEREGMTADDLEIELGGPDVQPEFNEHLTGVKTDDVREFRVQYPAEFTSPGLAGKTLDFTATVVAVRRKELPEIDDDFAQEISDKKTLAELRESIRADHQSGAEFESQQQIMGKVLDHLTSVHEFAVPESLVNNQVEVLRERFLSALWANRIPVEQLREINWEERRQVEIERARVDVHAALIISRIAAAEGLRVTDEEIDQEIRVTAARERKSFDDLKASLTKDGGLDSIENRLIYSKALDFVVRHADITVEEYEEKASDTGPQEEPGAAASQSGNQPAQSA